MPTPRVPQGRPDGGRFTGTGRHEGPDLPNSGSDLSDYLAAGLTPRGAVQWRDAGIPVTEFPNWKAAGLRPRTAGQWRDQGIAAEDVAEWRELFSAEDAGRLNRRMPKEQAIRERREWNANPANWD